MAEADSTPNIPVGNLPSLEDRLSEPPSNITFAETFTPPNSGDLGKNDAARVFDEVVRSRTATRIWSKRGLAAAVAAQAAFGALGLVNHFFWIGNGAAALLTVITTITISTMYSPFAAYAEIKKSEAFLTERLNEGYVFATQLAGHNVIPSAARSVTYVPVNHEAPFGGMGMQCNLYLVKPNPAEATVVEFNELRKHTEKLVVVKARISSTSRAEDMKIGAEINLAFSGGLFGFGPRSASGSIEGRIYADNTAFRIANEKGESLAASFGYLAYPDQRIAPPVAVKRQGVNMGAVAVHDRNDLVRFLDEAHSTGRELIMLGKLDSSGKFHAEAVANPLSRETFTLAVHQDIMRLDYA